MAHACEICSAVFTSLNSLGSHRGHCRYVRRFSIDRESMTHQNHHYEDEKLPIVDNEIRIDFENSQNDYHDEGISSDDENMGEEVEQPIRIDFENSQNDYHDEGISSDDENMGEGVEQPIVEKCRLFTKDELPSFDHHTMKYLKEQIAFGSDYFGIEALNTSTWSLFKKEVRVQIIILFHDLLCLGYCFV